MEIARPEAIAILGRPRHAFGQSRPGRLAATGAGINQTPMLGELNQPLRQSNTARRLATAEGRPAMAAGRGLMGHDPVRLGGLGAGSRPCGLSAPRPIDPTAREGSLASPGGHRSTAAWSSSNYSSQGAAELRVPSPQRFQLPLKRRDQSCDLRRKNHPSRESYSRPPDPCQIHENENPPQL